MENNLILEQPEIQPKTGDVNEQITQEESPLHLDDSGSNFGKFKDATSLLPFCLVLYIYTVFGIKFCKQLMLSYVI